MFTFAGLEVIPHHVGPWTMHRIARDGMQDQPTFFGQGDSMIFCFGEIDVRCHIKKQALEQQRGPEEVIAELAKDYIGSLQKFGQTRTDLKLFVLSVVPPARAEHIAPLAGFPVIGTDQERASFTRTLNERLEQHCNDVGIGYIDIHTPYADEDGMLPRSLADVCSIHIADTRYVRRALETAGLA